MLEVIRKYSGSPIVKAFLIILAFTFLFFFGITDIIRKFTGNDYVVKIGNLKVTPLQFKMEKARKINLMRKQSADDKEITKTLLHQLIWENIINIFSKEYGLIISDETMEHYIGSMEVFKDANGRFNANLLRGFLQKIQVPEEIFIESSKREIKSAIISAPFSGISINNELPFYVEAKKEKRAVTFVELNPESFSIGQTPSEEELQQYHNEHSNQFMIPEVRSFTVVEMQENKLVGKVVITDDELREAYETSSERDERSFDDMRKELEEGIRSDKLESVINEFTRNIEDELMAGADIYKVAKKYDLKLIELQNMEMGNAAQLNKLPYKKDVMNVAFTLDEGTDSSFSESLGENKERVLWLVRVHSVTPKHNSIYKECREAVLKAWTKNRKHQLALDLANSWIKNKDKKLEKLAKAAGRLSKISPLFDREGKQNGNPEKDKDVIDCLFKDVFSLDKGDMNYIEHNGKLIVYQIEKIESPNPSSEELKEGYKELLTQMREDMSQALVGYLSKEYEVRVNSENLRMINEEIDSEIDLF